MKSNTHSLESNKFLRCMTPIAGLSNKVYSRGTLPSSRLPTIAIIGTRRPTLYGTRVAFEFAEKLARAGIVVISGLAYGIDTAAHQGALQGRGVTIAVLAHGLDTVYPSGNQQLAEAIVKSGGALISPYPDGTPVHKYRFLERNQWVSGLADAVLVIEAEERSGTKATVRYALDQGREVFAIPGPITSPQSHGPNQLIKDGAHPALSVEDIITAIAPNHHSKYHQVPLFPHLSKPARKIVTLLQQGSLTSAAIAQSTDLSIHTCLAELTILELDGVIRQQQGTWTYIQ